MKNEIIPKEVNPTEERQMKLLLNLMQYPAGLSLEILQNRIMKFEYEAENRDSAQKKFKRDIDELKALGFAIKRYADDLDENKSFYKLINANDSKIAFSDEELKQISLSVMKHYNKNASESLLSAAQKIFASHLDLFPPLTIKHDKNGSGKETTIIEKIIQALRDKIPLRIEYKKTAEKNELREIEPLNLIKKNADEFYLAAWDRKEKGIRRFMIKKIGKITELDGDFLFRQALQEHDLNLHPLNVNIHEKEQFVFRCSAQEEWKMNNFLNGADFVYSQKTYQLNTTNKQALFDFVIRESSVLSSADPKLIDNLEKYRKSFRKLYESNNI